MLRISRVFGVYAEFSIIILYFNEMTDQNVILELREKKQFILHVMLVKNLKTSTDSVETNFTEHNVKIPFTISFETDDIAPPLSRDETSSF